MTYIVVGVVLLVLLVIGLVLHDSVERNAEADAKADQLIAELAGAGLPVPSRDQIVLNVLGDDGGAVCADPTNYLKVGAGPQLDVQRRGRPGHAAGDRRRGRWSRREALAIKVYCPDQLAEYQNFVNSHKYADVIKE